MSLAHFGINPRQAWREGDPDDHGFRVGQFAMGEDNQIYVCAEHTGDSVWGTSVYMMTPPAYTVQRINAARLNADIGSIIFVMQEGLTAPSHRPGNLITGDRFWGLVYGRGLVRIRANVNGGTNLYTSSSGTPGGLDDTATNQVRIHGIALDENGTPNNALAMIRFPSAT